MTNYIPFDEYAHMVYEKYGITIIQPYLTSMYIWRRFRTKEEGDKFMLEDQVAEDLDPREIIKINKQINASRKPMSYYLQDPVGC